MACMWAGQHRKAYPAGARFQAARTPLRVSSAMASLAAAIFASGIEAVAAAPLAGAGSVVEGLGRYVNPHTAIALAGVVGLILALTVTAIGLLRERQRSRAAMAAATVELERLRRRCDSHAIILAGEPQVIVSWPEREAEPVVEGDLGAILPGVSRQSVLAFGSWLSPAHAQALDGAISVLKERGERFHLDIRDTTGRYFEADGRVIGEQAVLRLREMTGEKRDVSRLRDALTTARGDLAALRTMLDAMPQPIWLRDREGGLIWVNMAYAAAVGAADGAEVVARQIEILDHETVAAARRETQESGVYEGRVSPVVAGRKLMLDVVQSRGGGGSAGMAYDVAPLEAAQADLRQLREAHARTFDRLTTAVAIFDASRKLVFYNTSYRQLWALDEGFLASAPADGEVLERLRARRRLPEQADFRKWKNELHIAYDKPDTQEHWWYLPDGRTLRVVLNPNPQGGVTYLFDDVSERFRLESRYNALMRMQGETLDSLREGVAVFGSDGRLRLSNPAFSDLWEMGDELIADHPHIDAIATHSRPLTTDDSLWDGICAAVAGMHDKRTRRMVRLLRTDGSVVDCAVAPLPDGVTLLTFTDMTDSVKAERALLEKNEALEKAARLRDDFVHHVSYELRSPLTSTIGFAQLLGEETVGPLNDKQREYASHITRSSEAVLALINDILDLASIDGGTIELDVGEVDVAETVAGAIRGLGDRLAEKNVRLEVDVPVETGSFSGDAKRVRQVLYNLLSNSVAFSAAGEVVTIRARRSEAEVLVSVSDFGPPFAAEHEDGVVDRPDAIANGRQRRMGLGLSLVRSFVELHGGRVDVSSLAGERTRVTCAFPVRRPSAREAAA